MECKILKCGCSSLQSDSPRQFPNTNSFNNHYVVQCCNAVVQTSAAEPLNYIRPFAVARCPAWLLSKESHRLWVSKTRHTKMFYTILPHPLVTLSLQSSTQKHKGSKELCSQYYGKGRLNVVQKCLLICLLVGSFGDGKGVASKPPRARRCYTSPCREIGQQGDLDQTCAACLFSTAGCRWPGNNLRVLSVTLFIKLRFTFLLYRFHQCRQKWR